MRNYDLIRETTSAAANRWPLVLSQGDAANLLI